MLRYPFDTVWKVRADYEHFLRCFNISSIEELPPLPNDEEDNDENENSEQVK